MRERDERKKKLSEVILGICQLSSLSLSDVKNVLEVLTIMVNRQIKKRKKA